MRMLLSSAVLLSALLPATARPCSLAPRNEAPIYSDDILDGPPLLFFDELSDPNLYAAGSTLSFGLKVTPRPELGTPQTRGRPAILAEVSGPLAPGRYYAMGQGFEISPQGRSVRAVPVPPADTRLELRIFEGTCGQSGVDVLFPYEQAKHTAFVLSARTADGRVEGSLLYSPAALEQQSTGFQNIAFTEERVCYQLQGLALDGTVGSPLDLGCIDPTDSDDPRVVYTGGGMFGCSSVTPSIELPALSVLLGGLALRRRRRSAA
jgi:hypothetical protein